MPRRSLLALACAFVAIATHAEDIDPFDYVLGTQAIGGRYQFTKDTRLLEGAKRMREMGSNSIKFALSQDGSFGVESGNVPARDPSIVTLTDLASREPSHRAVFDMPFAFYFLWTYPLTSKSQAATFKPADRDAQYREIYDFTRHLLRTYNGTGKQFFLGHWEGDWHLRPHYDRKKPFPPGYAEQFIDWLKIRQKAITDARRDTPHENVQVWHYTEANLVMPYLKGGSCLANDILPNVDVDYVSYSCYDALNRSIHDDLFAALNHIESKLKPRSDIPGKRVFIGEYGFPRDRFSAAEQNAKSIEVLRAAIDWGCPFALYWELYCNEQKNGKPRGFWLIDDKNEKQPVYRTHERFLNWAKAFVAAETKRDGHPPTTATFRAAALKQLDQLADAK